MFYPSIKAQLFGEIASYLFLDLNEHNDFIYMKRASTFAYYNAENDILITIYGQKGGVPNAIFIERINNKQDGKEIKKSALDTKFFELFTKNLENTYGENIQKLKQTNVQHFYVEMEQQFSEKKYLDNNDLLPSFRFCKDHESNIYIRANNSINENNLQPFIVAAFSVLLLVDCSTNNTFNLIDVILRKKSLKDLIKDKYTAKQMTTNYYNVKPKQIKAFKLWELVRSKEDLKLFLIRGDDYEEFHFYITERNSIAYDIKDTSSNTKFLVSNDIDFEEVCQKFDTVHEMDFHCGTELTYWIRSNKDTSLIYKDAIPCNDYIDPIKYEYSIKVINGPAGCGKSFSLNKIMHEMQSVDKASWIESLYGSDLEKMLCENSNADDILNVLKKLFKITNSLEEDIFNFNLKIPGRLVLFVDDIDNINKKSTAKVLNFIKQIFFDYPTVIVWMSCSEGFGDIIVETIPIFPHTLTYEKDLIDSMLPQEAEAMTVNVIEKIHKQNSQAILKNPFNIDLIRQKIEKDGSEGSLYILDVYDFYIEQKLLDFANETSVKELERSAAYIFFGNESGLDIDLEENLVFHTVFGIHNDRVIIEYLTAKYLLNHPLIINNIMFKKEMFQLMNLYNRLQFRHSKFGSLVLNGKFEEMLILAEKESPALVTDMLNRTLLYIVDDQCEYAGILDFLREKVPIDKINNLTNGTIETYFDNKRAFKYIEILLRHGADWTKFNSILKCDSKELGSLFLNNCLEDNYKICELIIDQRKDYSVTPYHVFVATKLTCYDSHDFIIKTLRLAVKQGLAQQKPYLANYVGSACHNAARFCPRALEIMKILVEELNFDIHLTDCLGCKPIFYANDIKLFKYLIEKGADPFFDESNINLTSPFHSACLSGNMDIVKYYMEELSPDMELLNQIPPLYFAVRSGSLKLLKYLYEKGFTKVNEPYVFGEPPIYLACENGNFEMVKFFVEHGVDVNSTFENKRPIDALGRNGAKQNVLNIFNYLVDNGCVLKTNLLYILLETLNYKAFQHYCQKLEVDWDYKNSDGHTLLHYAALKVHDKDILEYIATRSNLELLEDQDMVTALHLAFSVGNVGAVDILIKLEANINAKSKKGLTMMHFAAKSPNKSLFQLLFNHGLDINQKDNEGKSPIHTFVYFGKYDLASYLIQNGMHPNSQDNEGSTALHTICRSNRNCTPEGVECCLRDLKVNPHIRDNTGRTALHYAIEKYSIEVLLMIFSKYTRVDFDAIDASGDSLLSLSQKMDIKSTYIALCNIKSNQKYID